MLIIQGECDPFGMPAEAPGRTVVRVTGDHSLRADMARQRDAVGAWLTEVLAIPR